MIRKPKIIKEMAAPQAKTEIKNLLDYMKDTISIQNYVTLKNPFPATVILKNPVSINATFNLMMSFTVSEKDKNFHANSLIESAFIRCWTSVKRTYPEVDIRIRGANVFISTDEYEVLENCIKDFVKLWKPQEFALIKKLSK